MTKKECLYLALYKFLRENHILGKYVQNIIDQDPSRKRANAKYVLKDCVRIVLDDDFDADIFLFSNINASFDWIESEEGVSFWAEYDDKWEKYIKDFKEKYRIL